LECAGALEASDRGRHKWLSWKDEGSVAPYSSLAYLGVRDWLPRCVVWSMHVLRSRLTTAWRATRAKPRPPQAEHLGVGMNLLHSIYGSPLQLLAKAKRDGQALTAALTAYDEPAMRDALFDFAVSAYHIVDWVKAYRPELEAQVFALLDNCEAIAACRDLCNASKHVTLTLDRGGYLHFPPVVDAVTISAAASTSLGELKKEHVVGRTSEAFASVGWKLKIQLKSGRRISAEHLVAEAVDAWEKFFADHCIQ